jgi:1-deoxyxylulose-5-phosphate synthase
MAFVNRRDFIQRSAQVLTAAWAAAGLPRKSVAAALEGAVPAYPRAAARRSLGKSGVSCSLLGMGTGTRAWNGSSAQNRQGDEAFIQALVHALDRGLRYFDMAGMYGAHKYMQQAVKAAAIPREKLTFLTKTVGKDGETVRKDLDRFRKELDTDYLDIVLLHCMQDAAWNKKLKPCMDVLSAAKEKGQIRAHGVSCHDLGALETAAEEPWADILLARINPFGVKMDGPPDAVLPVLKTAHANGKGMLGMKILGEGAKAGQMAESLKYVLNLGCIDAITIGFLTPEEIDTAIKQIEAVEVS